jgi:hypothetical protein
MCVIVVCVGFYGQFSKLKMSEIVGLSDVSSCKDVVSQEDDSFEEEQNENDISLYRHWEQDYFETSYLDQNTKNTSEYNV